MQLVEFLDQATRCNNQHTANDLADLLEERLAVAFLPYGYCVTLSKSASLPMKKAPELLVVFGVQISRAHMLSITTALSAGELDVAVRLSEYGYDLYENCQVWKPVNLSMNNSMGLGVPVKISTEDSLDGIMARAIGEAKHMQLRLMLAAGVPTDETLRLIEQCWHNQSKASTQGDDAALVNLQEAGTQGASTKDDLIRSLLAVVRDLDQGYPWSELHVSCKGLVAEAERLGVDVAEVFTEDDDT